MPVSVRLYEDAEELATRLELGCEVKFKRQGTPSGRDQTTVSVHKDGNKVASADLGIDVSFEIIEAFVDLLHQASGFDFHHASYTLATEEGSCHTYLVEIRPRPAKG